MKKINTCILSILLVASMLLTAGCNNNASEITTEQQTTEAVTEVQTDEEAKKELLIGPDELGLDIYAFRSDSENVTCESSEDGITVKSVAKGQATVTVYNSYAETAKILLSVDDKLNITSTVEKYTPPQNSYIATDYGARNNGDVTTALQTCIDKAHAAGGGTVYLPCGVYKVGTLSMKSGVTLRLEGFIPDARCGYTDEVKELVTYKKLTIMYTNGAAKSNFFFLNVIPQSYCTAGESDFTVSGGVWQCEAKMKLIGMACGNNIVFENMIVKDNPNNHAFQIEGCTNVLVQNIMFAGYNYPKTDAVLTRETIQLEPTTPGAIGSNYDTNVIKCNDGDYHHCYNVKINNCYFGKSDKYGPHLVAVGHHSASGSLVCDGFEFTNNVVDNPLYCGLHLPNYLNVKISGNTFISTSPATSSALAEDSALISLYGFTSDNKYTLDNKNVYYAFSYEHPGTQHFEIYNNNFELGGGTHLRVMRIVGATTNYNSAQFLKNASQYRVSEYGKSPAIVNEYVLMRNCAADINIHDNSIKFLSGTAYKGYFSFFQYICGLSYENNTVSLPQGLDFSSNTNGMKGVKAGGIVTGNDVYTRKITMSKGASKKATLIVNGQKTIIPNPTQTSVIYILKTDGNGRIDLSVDVNGNLEVTVTAFEGHTFKGFVDKNGKTVDISKSVSASVEYTAIFE